MGPLQNRHIHARPAPPPQLRARYERALSVDPHIEKLLDQACLRIRA